MKQMKNLLLIKFVFLWVILTFFTTGQDLFSGDNGDTPVLARVEVAGMLNDLELPVYAHLKDAAGKDYALVIAPTSQLDRAGARYRILDKNTGGADYFILTVLSGEKRSLAEKLSDILLNDGEQLIVRSTFPQVEAYAELGFDVQRLGRTAMVLAVPQPSDVSVSSVDYDATVAQMIGQVTQSTVETYARNLSGENPVNIGGSDYTILTRYTDSGTPIEKATQYVYEFMQGCGLSVNYHDWTASIYTGRNVIGELTGTTQPDEIVLITAHLDCMPSGGTAPGADDNASGSVGVMVSAQLLSQHQFRRTLRFVFFTGEEQGLLGSYAYADAVYQSGDNITAVYNMDMISYDAVGGPDLRLHTRTTTNPGYPGDLAIANTFVDVVNVYSLDSGLAPIIDPDGIGQSDHSPFWSKGYSAILGIEDHDYDMSPYYHLATDTVSTLNMTYFTNFVKASVGSAAHLAIRDDGTLIADFTASPTTGGVPLTVHFTDQSVGATSWSWDFGDTGTSAERHPVHTYTEIGAYTVTLTVTNAVGSDTMVKTDYITVTPPQLPVADFSASATDIVVGDMVTFTDLTTENPTSWDWTFDGGTPGGSADQNPTVTYNSEGIFTVTLTATNIVGSDTETKVNYINVAGIPYCESQGNTYSMEWIAGVQVDAMDNASNAAGYTDFTSITCNLNGGDSVDVTLTPGFSGSTYTEYWKIWIDYNGDHDFEDAGEEVFSGVGSSAVNGNFTVSPGIDVVTRMRVSMKYGGYPTPCETFTYGEVEDYTAIIVSGGEPPVADFTYTATDLTAYFTDTGTDPDGSIVGWYWDFGDTDTSTEQNPVHAYAAGGTYTVTLTVTDNDGLTDSVDKPVTVTEPGAEIYVYDITQTIKKAGKNYQSTAVVTIWDTNNNTVADATVYITWSDAVGGTASGVTAADGTVSFVSDKVKSSGPFTITVDNVSHAGLPYNPALNNETSDSAGY